MEYTLYVLKVVRDGLCDSRTVFPTLVLILVVVPTFVVFTVMAAETALHIF